MTKKAAAAAVTRQREAEAEARNPKTVARSAKTGRIVKKVEADADPDGTFNQEVNSPLEVFLAKFVPPTKIPKNPGAAADLLYTTREDRLRLAKIVTAMEDFEKLLRQDFIDNLSKKDSTGVAGKKARVQIVTEDQPVVQDWDEFYKHIKKKGEFDLLNRAVNRSAVRARWDNGKAIPGVGSFTVSKVSVTKV